MLCVTGLAVGIGSVSSARMAPEPDPVPRKWQLDVSVGPLRMATVELNDHSTHRYFYLTYKVTNQTQGDVLFAPSFELATDDGEVLRSGRDVPSEATRKIVGDLSNPMLQDQISIVGSLLQGEENAREGIVIWPANDLMVNEISIYGSGFSGETKVIQTLDTKENKSREVVLRKTLSLRYPVAGDLTNISSGQEFVISENRWIMR
jgi:hypothetical protein